MHAIVHSSCFPAQRFTAAVSKATKTPIENFHFDGGLTTAAKQFYGRIGEGGSGAALTKVRVA